MSNPRTIAPDGTVSELGYTETPRYIQIETNLACNARCPFCPYASMHRGPMFMADWIWKKILADTRGLGVTYRPFLINEPLTDKRLAQIVAAIKSDPTARAEINTNGGILTEERGRALLDAGIDVVRFSIDGFSRATYEPARPGVDYDQVVANTNRFIALRDAGGYDCRIEARMIDMPENKHEQAAFLDYWGQRADVALVVPLYQWPWSGQTAPVLKPCLKILDEMFFYTDGTAPLCCWDDSARAVVGDVKTQSVLDIWRGPVLAAMRALLDRGRRDLIGLCSRCDAYKEIRFVGFETPEAAAAPAPVPPAPARV